MTVSTSLIPERTIERLSQYRRVLLGAQAEHVTHVFSHHLADFLGITAVQVRRDLMLIGFSSDTKKGYDVAILIDFIGRVLDDNQPMHVGVIGMGHLGQAVTKYFTGKRSKLKIVASFDVDPTKVNTWIDGIPCYAISELKERVSEHQIQLVLLSVPARASSDLVAPIIAAGIGGVLNFTSKHLHFPDPIYIEDYDIITLLEKVAYYVKNRR